MPPGEFVQYRYVSMRCRWMQACYDAAEELYLETGWNDKATPVCALVRDETLVSLAVANGGTHARLGHCSRTAAPGAPYSDCLWCMEFQHAEQLALVAAQGKDLMGADAYLYGHWRMCQSCVAALRSAGVRDFVLLEGSEELFDRHNPKTVIGKMEQFML